MLCFYRAILGILDCGCFQMRQRKFGPFFNRKFPPAQLRTSRLLSCRISTNSIKILWISEYKPRSCRHFFGGLMIFIWGVVKGALWQFVLNFSKLFIICNSGYRNGKIQKHCSFSVNCHFILKIRMEFFNLLHCQFGH